MANGKRIGGQGGHRLFIKREACSIENLGQLDSMYIVPFPCLTTAM